MICIYDKVFECGLLDGMYWICVEVQMCDDNVIGVFCVYLDSGNIGGVFFGILVIYLVYCEELDDLNKSCWLVVDYWVYLIQDVDWIYIVVVFGVDYNIFYLEVFFWDIVGGVFQIWIEIFGLDLFFEVFKQCKFKFNLKYQCFLDIYCCRNIDQ